MCVNFEVISGKKSRKSVDKLEGLTKMYRDAGMNVAIVKIPVDMLEIDTRYQTDIRTNRSLRYLVSHWDENKLLPLVGVPHWEEGAVYLVDGYGRWIASQMVDKEKYKDLAVLLILSVPEDKEVRLKFEAELYAFQNKDIARMTGIQKHGAMLCIHDPAAETLEKLKAKYGFEYKSTPGQRDAAILGSYDTTLKLCKIDNGKCAEFIFDICTKSGFDRKANGYSRMVMKALKDVYKLYANDRDKTKKFLSRYLRKTDPIHLKAEAVAKYYMLDTEAAVSLYIEDIVVDNLGLQQSRTVSGDKVVSIDAKKTA